MQWWLAWSIFSRQNLDGNCAKNTKLLPTKGLSDESTWCQLIARANCPLLAALAVNHKSALPNTHRSRAHADMLSHALTSYFSLRTEWLMNAHISPDLHGRVPHEVWPRTPWALHTGHVPHERCTLAMYPMSSAHWPYIGHVPNKLCILVTVAYSIRYVLAV